jgi:hypothetical protein
MFELRHPNEHAEGTRRRSRARSSRDRRRSHADDLELGFIRLSELQTLGERPKSPRKEQAK